MVKEEAFALDLPKWPQCVIKGKPVTKEQAMDIILRTDTFFTMGYEGNDHYFCHRVKEIVGLPTDDIYEIKFGTPEWEEYRRKEQEFREKTHSIILEYLHNSWISCSWIGGAHGWCSPNGEIAFQNNIGKWPTVEEVYEDLRKMGSAFPYLELTCTLVSAEEDCYEEDTKTVVTMQLKDGEVTFFDEPIPLDKLEYGGVKGGIWNLNHETAFTLGEIEKWWGHLKNK